MSFCNTGCHLVLACIYQSSVLTFVICRYCLMLTSIKEGLALLLLLDHKLLTETFIPILISFLNAVTLVSVKYILTKTTIFYHFRRTPYAYVNCK
jgi:hypothetical protein